MKTINKRFCVIILAVLLIAVFILLAWQKGLFKDDKVIREKIVAGTSSKVEETTHKENKNLKKKPLGDTVEFKLDGKKLSIPFTYKDIKALGYEFEFDESKNNSVSANHTSSPCNLKNSEGKKITVNFYNNTKGELVNTKCKISQITVSSLLGYDPDFTINGVGIGFNYYDVITVLGEPAYKHRDSNSGTIEYDVKDGNKLKFNCKDDVVCEIILYKDIIK